MTIRPWLWGKRTALAGGATLIMLLHAGIMPLLHLALLPLLAAVALGAMGAVSGNPWLISAAVLVALAVVAWRARRHENRTTRVFQDLAGSYGYPRVRRKAVRGYRPRSTAANLSSRHKSRRTLISSHRSQSSRSAE